MWRSLAIFLSGFSSAMACTSAGAYQWGLFAFFFAWAVGALTWALLPKPETCRHGNRVADGTESYRRARLALVKTGES